MVPSFQTCLSNIKSSCIFNKEHKILFLKALRWKIVIANLDIYILTSGLSEQIACRHKCSDLFSS